MSAYRNSNRHNTTAPPSLTAQKGRTQDLIWGRPVFKAPKLPNPRAAFEPLPFTATRITRSPAEDQGI